MIELSNSTIDKSCRMVRVYFPSTFILDIFKDITGDQELANFPSVKIFEETFSAARGTNRKIPVKAVAEMSSYFYEDGGLFLVFLKSLTSQSVRHGVVNKIPLDDFISKVNTLLLRDSNVRIENYETIQKWVPNRAKKSIFLNVNVPEYIQDYFAEGLDCLAHELYRSCILFCSFALEASLRCKYAGLVDEDKAYSVKFSALIDWGIENNLIDRDNFNKANIEFVRKYRNDLAHCNMNEPSAGLRTSRGYAKKMSSIVTHLIEFFINDIFY